MPKKFLSFGSQWGIDKQFSEALENPDVDWKKEFVERVKPMANLLEETVATRGWKEIIQPFIEKQLQPEKLIDASQEERLELKGFLKLYRLVNNVVKIGRTEIKEESSE